MPFSYKPSRYFDPREELDPTYQLALGTIFDDEEMEGEFKRIVKSSDFYTTPSEFAKQLHDIEKDDIELWVASIGGSLSAMSHINELLQDQINKGKNLLIKNVKMAYSAATLPFIQLKSRREGGRVRTETAPLATFMIHNMSVNLSPPNKQMSADDLRELSEQIVEIASYTDRKNQEIANFYASNTKLTREEIDEYMRKERIFTASEAVEAGFVGKVGSTSMFDGKQEDEKDPYTDDEMYMLYSLCAMADMKSLKEKGKAEEEAKAKAEEKAEGTPTGEEAKADPSEEAHKEWLKTPQGRAFLESQVQQAQEENSQQKQQSEEGKAEPPKAPDNPPQPEEVSKMEITPEQAAEVRAKLKMKDDEEVTEQHVIKAWQMEQAENREMKLVQKAEAKANLKNKIEEGLAKYFDAKVINAAERAEYTATIMAAPDPDAQLKSIQGLLDRAMPSDPPPADPPADPTGGEQNKGEEIDGDPGKGKVDPPKGDDDLTPVEQCSKAFYDVLNSGGGTFQAYSRAYSHIRRKFKRNVVEDFECQGQVMITTSENSKSKIEDLEKIERHKNAIKEERILC